MTKRLANPDLVVDDDHSLAVPDAISGRAAPVLTAESDPFWDGLSRGSIVLPRCTSCDRLAYIAAPGCPWCGHDEVRATEVDGHGELYSFTVCYLAYGPGLDVPYVVGVVAPSCEPALRIVTNVVGCRIREVRIGMALEPIVVPADHHHLLLYRPEGTS